MILEPFWLTLTKRILVIVMIFGAWLWMSAEEYEEEQAQPPRIDYTIPEPAPSVEEDEPEQVVQEQPQDNYGWVLPLPSVRKHVGKIKRAVKRSI